MAGEVSVVPVERIERGILLIRRHKVMLDGDLADLYSVPVKVLKPGGQAQHGSVPPLCVYEDFMFQLDHVEAENLRSQIVTSSWGVS